MGKLGLYVIVMCGLLLLFYFAGLTKGTPNTDLVTLLLNPQNLKTSSIGLKIDLIIGFILGFTVLSKFFTGNIQLTVNASFVAFMFTTLWDFITIVNKVMSINYVLGVLIFAPLLMLYFVTLIEFLGGRD